MTGEAQKATFSSISPIKNFFHANAFIVQRFMYSGLAGRIKMCILSDKRMWVDRPEGNNSSQMLAKITNLRYNNPDNIKHSASESRAAFALTKGV